MPASSPQLSLPASIRNYWKNKRKNKQPPPPPPASKSPYKWLQTKHVRYTFCNALTDTWSGQNQRPSLQLRLGTMSKREKLLAVCICCCCRLRENILTPEWKKNNVFTWFFLAWVKRRGEDAHTHTHARRHTQQQWSPVTLHHCGPWTHVTSHPSCVHHWTTSWSYSLFFVRLWKKTSQRVEKNPVEV